MDSTADEDEVSYRRRYESVMNDDEPGWGNCDGDADADGGGKSAHDFNDNIWSNHKPTTYSEQMMDVLGSDGEDDDARGYDVEPRLPSSSDMTNGAPTLVDTSTAAMIDDEVTQTKDRFAYANVSNVTEDTSSVSALSLRPSRPWQFPAPRRLRVLRGDEGSNTSLDSSSQLASPSVRSSSDDGTRTLNELLPYGEPLTQIPHSESSPLLNGTSDEHETKSASLVRSFLRLQRLCILNDKEGSPTVMAVQSGIIAVGTKQGKVGLYDRSRGWTGAVSVEGSVSALAISSDKTFLAVATSLGHIFLYDMARLHAPQRHVAPVTAQAIASGRSEGHLQNSRILHVGFVGTRHTAIVSADEHGLSFFHSLGKILGVSSNDTLRILGRYPDAFEENLTNKSTVLAMAALPLGPQQHQSDSHNFVALLTPSKLVLVGLKPTARTWYRRLSPYRNGSEEECISGCLAWRSCSKAGSPSSATSPSGLVLPTLAFSFGKHVYLVRLHAQQEHEDVTIREWKSYTHTESIEAMRWLSNEGLALYARRQVWLYDVRKGKCTEEQAFVLPISQRWPMMAPLNNHEELLSPLAGSVQSHKGQLFVLTANEIVVASLIHFSDRLLAHVSQGDSLGAIELATKYLLDPAEGGSRLGLPERYEEQKPILTSRLLELMRASTSYAFSEDRLKDDLAHNPQGVDRTPFFKGLAQVCAKACLALHDFSFLFDELYDAYAEAGIETIFADEMEEFIIQGKLRTLPIPVVQRLVNFRKTQERYDLAERIIRNVEPSCLDLDQAITLCLEQRLYDALIYIYTRALQDYVGPLVELLPMIKDNDSDAYRVFSYLSVVLIGRTYPDQDILSESDGQNARSSIYTFLFSGTCVLWPNGPGGRLVLTRDSDGLDEPTFPYARIFLQFDAEAYLDALDVGFEDVWLDDHKEWSRQKIISILYGIADERSCPFGVRTFVAIFIARNAPKYPQFIDLIATQVDALVQWLSYNKSEEETLVEDDGKSLKDDRQFAVECLLSVYKPAQTDELLSLFEQAGFTDLLRRVYRSAGKWDKLAEMIVSQSASSSSSSELTFDDLDEILRKAEKKSSRVVNIVLQALGQLVDLDVGQTALLVQRRLSSHLSEAIHVLDRSPHRQLAFLSEFVNGPSAEKLDKPVRSLFIGLLCSMHPEQVVKCLDGRASSYFDISHLCEVAREEDVLDAWLWAQDRKGETEKGFDGMAEGLSERAFILRSTDDAEDGDTSQTEEQILAREQIQSVFAMAVRICSEHGKEQLWIQLLQMLINFTHDVHEKANAMSFARFLLQDALSSFVSSTGAEQVSFSSLFTKLTPQHNSTYAEVRDISDAMMGAYKVRQELLGITNRLFDRDVFTAMQHLTRKRRRGWRPLSTDVRCQGCGKPCIGEARRRHGDGKAQMEDGKRSAIRVNGHGRKSIVGGLLDASHLPPLPRSPSFLEPPISPRPDKGKGVVREHQGQNALLSNDSTISTLDDSVESLGANSVHSSGPDGRTDYFTMQASDPAEMFLSTPPVTDRSMLSGETSFQDAHRRSIDQSDVLDNADAIIEDDALVVCFTGEVWHKRCYASTSAG